MDIYICVYRKTYAFVKKIIFYQTMIFEKDNEIDNVSRSL